MTGGLRAGFWVDTGPRAGWGHLSRCEAIAQVLRSRGWTVGLLQELTLPSWAQIAFPVLHDAATTVRGSVRRQDVLIFDSYSPAAVQHLQSVPKDALTIWIQDSDSDVSAHIVIDPNYGARSRPTRNAHCLAGSDYAPIREQIRMRANIMEPVTGVESDPILHVSLGGILDELAASYTCRQVEKLGEQVLCYGDAFMSPVVPVHAGRPDASTVRLRPSDPAWLDCVVAQDTVLCSAGVTIWELFALGIPVAVSTMNAKQSRVVRRLSDHQLILDVGPKDRWRTSAISDLRHLMRDPSRRQEIRQRTRAVVDGLGAERIVNAIEARV